MSGGRTMAGRILRKSLILFERGWVGFLRRKLVKKYLKNAVVVLRNPSSTWIYFVNRKLKQLRVPSSSCSTLSLSSIFFHTFCRWLRNCAAQLTLILDG